MKPERYEEIRAKLDEVDAMDFSTWTPQQVARHLIAAGKWRNNKKQKPYEFPGYIRFPRKLFE